MSLLVRRACEKKCDLRSFRLNRDLGRRAQAEDKNSPRQGEHIWSDCTSQDNHETAFSKHKYVSYITALLLRRVCAVKWGMSNSGVIALVLATGVLGIVLWR